MKVKKEKLGSNPVYHHIQEKKKKNIPKETEDLYSENYKILMKEIKDDTTSWEDTLCSWIGRVNIFQMTILPKAIYISMQSLSNYLGHSSQNFNKIF